MNLTLAAVAMMYLSVPGKWGGNNPMEGLDCSGLVNIPLKALGYIGSREDLSAKDIARRFEVGNVKDTDIENIVENDLLFFGPFDGDEKHVAIALGNGLMIEAAGVTPEIKTLEAAKEAGAYVKILPIKHRKDFLYAISLQTQE